MLLDQHLGIKKFIVKGILILICLTFFINTLTVSAEEKIVASSNISSKLDFSLQRQVGNPISLTDMGYQSWSQVLIGDTNLSKDDLLKTSKRLRDISRSLGSYWPISVSIPNLHEENDTSKNLAYSLTDFRKENGQWNSLSAGYALKLVTQEIVTLESKSVQPFIDFLVPDDNEKIYRPLQGVPLDVYCKMLMKVLNITKV